MSEHNLVENSCEPRTEGGRSSEMLRYATVKGTRAERMPLRNLAANPDALLGRSLVTLVSPRVLRAFEFSGATTWDDVLGMSVSDLMAVKYLSPRCIDEVIDTVIDKCGLSPDQPQAVRSQANLGASSVSVASITPAATVRISPIGRLAVAMYSIYHDRGAGTMAARLDAWCPDVPDGEVGRAPDLEAEPTALTAAVDEGLWQLATRGIFADCRRLGRGHWPIVLRSRILVEGKPETLAAVGETAGVTRERIRQIENVLRSELDKQLRGMRLAPIRLLASDVADALGEVTTREEIDTRVRDAVLATSTTRDEVALVQRRGLLRIALGEYVDQGELAVRPPIKEALDDLQRGIGMAGRGALLSAEEIDRVFECLAIPASRHSELRESLGLHLLGAWYVDWRVSQPDKAVAVLAACGHPLTMNEIHEAVGFHASPRSLAARVQEDPRIRRLGKERYGLADWGGEEYSGILDELEQAIERNGGSIDLSRTVEQFVEQFGVSSQSVRSYANDRRFVTERGRLRFRTGDDPEVKYRRDPIELTPGTSLLDGVWHLRIDVNYDVLRGSGVSLRNAVAYEAGGEPDLTIGFDYGAAHIALYWGATQPNLGSVRPLVEALGCLEGDVVFLPLDGPEPRSARTVRRSDLDARYGLDRLQMELGLTPTEAELARPTLLRALGLPSGADLTAVADRLRDRGESALVDWLPEEYR